MTVSPATKIKIFNNYVSSRIFYGMEIAVARSSQLSAIGTIYTTNLKKVLGLKKSFNNDLLLKTTHLNTLLSILIDRLFKLISGLDSRIRPGYEHIDKLKVTLNESHRT
jgi:hypothetical protein